MKQAEFTGVATETAPKLIARQIKEAILAGTLEVRSRLPTEEELASQFGVSRGTIREALKRLAAENLLESRRGAAGGNFVRLPTGNDLRVRIAENMALAVSLDQFQFEDVLSCRFEFGAMCLRLAAENRTADDLKLLEQEANYQITPQVTDVDFCASDVRFHCQVAQATGNKIIAALASGVFEGVQPISNFILYKFRERKTIQEQHLRIIDALRLRDAPLAISVLQEQHSYLRGRHEDAKASRQQKMKLANAARGSGA